MELQMLVVANRTPRLRQFSLHFQEEFGLKAYAQVPMLVSNRADQLLLYNNAAEYVFALKRAIYGGCCGR